MAVRAHGPELSYRIYLVLNAYFREWFEVMHVYEASCDGTVDRFQIKLTSSTSRSMMLYALVSGFLVALVSVDSYLSSSSFKQTHLERNFFRKLLFPW